MPESSKEKLRCVFPPHVQKKFFRDVRLHLNLPSKELAQLVGVHSRTFNSWINARASVPLESVRLLATRARMSIPKHKTVRQYSWTTRAGSMGGEAILKKYGRVPVDEKTRKKAWEKWYARDGKRHLPLPFRQRIVPVPQKSLELAEAVGIILGDGHVGKRQITATFHHHDDKAYAHDVQTLFKNVFRCPVSIIHRPKNSVFIVTISRTTLVGHLTHLGLPTGNKITRQADIPPWIKRSVPYMTACVRGLMDTDGCIYQEVHTISHKKYSYPRMSFVSHSKPLRESVLRHLLALGIHAKIRNERSVTVERLTDILLYFKLVRSHNPKHLGRYKKFIGGVA